MGINDHRTDELLNQIEEMKKHHQELEAKARKENQRLQNIISGTDIGTWEWNIQTGGTTFNERWAEIIGYTLEELQPTNINTWISHSHTDDLKRSEDELKKHFDHQTDYYECESRMKHKDGHWVWVLDKGKVAEWDEFGKPLLMYGSHLEITQRKETEKILAESEERYNLALEGAEVGLWDFDMITKKSHFSPTYMKILGYDDAEMADSYDIWKQARHPDDAQAIDKAMKDYVEGRVPSYEITYRLRQKSGSWIWVLSRGRILKDSKGRPIRAIGTIIDITNQVRRKEINEELESFFNITPDLMCIVGQHAEFRKVNKAWATLLGYTVDDLQHMKFLEFIHPEDLRSSRAAMEKVRKEKQLVNFVNRMKAKDGKYRYFEWCAEYDNDLFHASGRDITDKRITEEKLQKDLKLKETFIDLIGHEGKTAEGLLERTLEQAIDFTGSKVGFIFLYDQGKDQFTLHSWSKGALAECGIKDQSKLCSLGSDGLWGQAITKKTPIIINDYAAPNPMKNGYPEGHLPVRNLMAVPVIQENKTVAIVAVANKGADFENEDITNLNHILNMAWPEVERIKGQETLNKERELFKTILFSIDEAILVVDENKKITLMNQQAEKYTGWTKEEAYGKDSHEVFNNVNIKTRKKELDPAAYVLEHKESLLSPVSEILISRDGTQRYIYGNASILASSSNSVKGVVLTCSDITKQYLQEREIETFMNLNLDMLCVADMAGRFLKVNRKFEEVLGYSVTEMEGKEYLSFIHEEDIPSTLEAVKELSEQKTVIGFTNRYRRKDGSFRYIEWHSEPYGSYIFSSARDVTDKYMKEEHLQGIAERDELTGLYNRHYLNNIINVKFLQTDYDDIPVSVIMFDIDHFKEINDRFGHQAGDQVLREIATISKRLIRKTDVLIRYGGEEFMLIMLDAKGGDAEVVAEKIRTALEEHSRCTASFGVAEKNRFESYASWYKRVDDALYKAKNDGRNRVVCAEKFDNTYFSSISLSWKEEWCSGDKQIDEQHKSMIDEANDLILLTLSGAEAERVKPHFDRLIELTKVNFDYEDKLMFELDYPNRKEHLINHGKLLSKARRILQLQLAEQLQPAEFISYMIDDVVVGHLGKDDMDLFLYMAGRSDGVSRPTLERKRIQL